MPFNTVYLTDLRSTKQTGFGPQRIPEKSIHNSIGTALFPHDTRADETGPKKLREESSDRHNLVPLTRVEFGELLGDLVNIKQPLVQLRGTAIVAQVV